MELVTELKLFPELLHFHGPFKFIKGDKYLFNCTFAKSSGIYIWTIKDEGKKLNFVEYIGQTPHFSDRQKYHLLQILSLNYRIISAAKAKQGKLDILWEGLWRMKEPFAVIKVLKKYKKLNHEVLEYINLLNIYFAPTDDLDNNMRCHLEGSIGWNLRKKHSDKVIFYPDDNHIGSRAEKYGEKITITTEEPIEGIGGELEL